MPKKIDRNVQDFSKYDAMSSEELAQILRLDSETPEGNGLDIDTLLYITGVLAERNSTGKTAQEAWLSFQQNYMDSEDDLEKAKPIRFRKPWVRRAVAAAAVVALVVCIPVTVMAVDWKGLWNTVATWANGTFCFVEEGQPVPDIPSEYDKQEFESLQQAIERSGGDSSVVPTWMPEGYVLENIDIEENPVQKSYIALYKNGEKSINICVRTYVGADPERVEINEELVETYTVSECEYYIFENNGWYRAVWIQDSCECSILGEITIDEIKGMIDSIPEG